ncbi:MAG: hypothetical protein HOQ05_06350 [Corynebacteriales bacterium]|nr:hypothetical protein [Mycobacteriales bacterium]
MARKLPLYSLLVGVIGVLVATMMPNVAQAAYNPYTASGVCGSGFRTLESRAVSNPYGGTDGYLVLMYRSSTNQNCAAYIKNKHAGSYTMTHLTLDLEGDGRGSVGDYGDFKYYGVARIGGASGHCVTWSVKANVGDYDQVTATRRHSFCG